jgi:hypothetical protein
LGDGATVVAATVGNGVGRGDGTSVLSLGFGDSDVVSCWPEPCADIDVGDGVSTSLQSGIFCCHHAVGLAVGAFVSDSIGASAPLPEPQMGI